jgi:hypothetical protein
MTTLAVPLRADPKDNIRSANQQKQEFSSQNAHARQVNEKIDYAIRSAIQNYETANMNGDVKNFVHASKEGDTQISVKLDKPNDNVVYFDPEALDLSLSKYRLIVDGEVYISDSKKGSRKKVEVSRTYLIGENGKIFYKPDVGDDAYVKTGIAVTDNIIDGTVFRAYDRSISMDFRHLEPISQTETRSFWEITIPYNIERVEDEVCVRDSTRIRVLITKGDYPATKAYTLAGGKSRAEALINVILPYASVGSGELKDRITSAGREYVVAENGDLVKLGSRTYTDAIIERLDQSMADQYYSF